MNNLQWSCIQFNKLNTHQLYEILKLRVNVFVVEQQCPYPELDDKDAHTETRHLCAHQDSKLIAYARLLAPGISCKDASIGRFVVEVSARRQGVGALLLEKCLEELNQTWPQHDIKISAQKYLTEFYEKFGFIQITDTYLEDGIPHISMLKVKENI